MGIIRPNLIAHPGRHPESINEAGQTLEFSTPGMGDTGNGNPKTEHWEKSPSNPKPKTGKGNLAVDRTSGFLRH